MIRIFVGCPANNEDIESQAVLDYSLKKYASEPFELEWMKLSRDPSSFWFADPQKDLGWRTKGWATPFSPFRWAVPERCNFEGKAIYMDVDMIACDDIAKLWNFEIMPGRFALAKNEKTFCCTLFDCEKARKILPPATRLRREVGLYRDVRRSFGGASVDKFNGKTGNWNCLDGEQYSSVRDPDIKILHCTSIPTQPQLPHALARLKAKGQKHWYKGTDIRPHWRRDVIELFEERLAEAKANGCAPERYETETIFGDYGR